jgi:Glycosyl transferase 4-like domain/Glycosyl transferases group 1
MRDVALLCPVSPLEPRDGHRMAVASDLNALLDNGLSVGVFTFLYGDQQPLLAQNCDVRYFAVGKGSFAVRLLRGLVGRIPPSSERLYTKDSIDGLRRALREWKPRFVVIDDVSMAGYIPQIREIVPTAKIILRTHNVMHDVRYEQLARTSGPTRLAVKFDSDRYRSFEAASLANADAHWAITQADASRMTELYGCTSHFLSVSIPMERYTAIGIKEGQTNHFVHVGTLDFRRRSDLESFLTTSWPRLREADATAEMTFAGVVHGKSIEAPGVRYAGPVSDDADVYRRGRFALNIQRSTGGIKLKTLTSLAAGRTLISTQHGVEGVPIASGKQYWDLNTLLSNGLEDVLADTAGLEQIAESGRAWVQANHSRAAVADQLHKLLQVV